MKSHRLELTTDLATVADSLLYALRSSISDSEYHDISGTGNPVKKMDKLLEAICARHDDQVFATFCTALKKVKFYVWAKHLEKFCT